MGTIAEIRVQGKGNLNAIVDAAFKSLLRVDRHMTLWKKSELTELNMKGFGYLSVDLANVVRAALSIASVSGGAFDPTVEPLLRKSGQLSDAFPVNQSVDDVEVNYRRLKFQPKKRHLHLNGTRLDLGGIAKGYAVDVAIKVIKDTGVDSAIVNLGQSSVKVYGRPETFYIKNPKEKEQVPWASFTINNLAFSTSALNQRPGHIIDPRNGRTEHKVLSATVISSSAMEADALSTAVIVLGPKQGLSLLRKWGAEGVILMKSESKYIVYVSKRLVTDNNFTVLQNIEFRMVNSL